MNEASVVRSRLYQYYKYMNMKTVNVCWGLVWICVLFISSVSSPINTRPVIIMNFGDANSDTGGVLAGAGLRFGLPHGFTFFHKGTRRFGDGRLILDFISILELNRAIVEDHHHHSHIQMQPTWLLISPASVHTHFYVNQKRDQQINI